MVVVAVVVIISFEKWSIWGYVTLNLNLMMYMYMCSSHYINIQFQRFFVLCNFH